MKTTKQTKTFYVSARFSLTETHRECGRFANEKAAKQEAIRLAREECTREHGYSMVWDQKPSLFGAEALHVFVGEL